MNKIIDQKVDLGVQTDWFYIRLGGGGQNRRKDQQTAVLSEHAHSHSKLLFIIRMFQDEGCKRWSKLVAVCTHLPASKLYQSVTTIVVGKFDNEHEN